MTVVWKRSSGGCLRSNQDYRRSFPHLVVTRSAGQQLHPRALHGHRDVEGARLHANVHGVGEADFPYCHSVNERKVSMICLAVSQNYARDETHLLRTGVPCG